MNRKFSKKKSKKTKMKFKKDAARNVHASAPTDSDAFQTPNGSPTQGSDEWESGDFTARASELESAENQISENQIPPNPPVEKNIIIEKVSMDWWSEHVLKLTKNPDKPVNNPDIATAFKAECKIVTSYCRIACNMPFFFICLFVFILTKISIFAQNFELYPKFRFLSKKFDFCPTFRILPEISMFAQNFEFYPKFRFFAKKSIFRKKIDF